MISISTSLRVLSDHQSNEKFNVIVSMSEADWKFWQEIKQQKEIIQNSKCRIIRIDEEINLQNKLLEYVQS